MEHPDIKQELKERLEELDERLDEERSIFHWLTVPPLISGIIFGFFFFWVIKSKFVSEAIQHHFPSWAWYASAVILVILAVQYFYGISKAKEYLYKVGKNLPNWHPTY